MRILQTTGVAASLIAAGTLIGASLSTLASVFDWSTTPINNATVDPNINWQEGMLPSAVNDSARAMMAAVAAWRQDQAAVPALAGSGNAFVITGTQPMAAWTPGLWAFRATRSNTGPVTIQRDGLTAKPLRAVSGADLGSGQIVNGSVYLVTYSTVGDEVLIVSPPAGVAAMAALTVKANITGSSAAPADVPLASFGAAFTAGSIPASAVSGFPGQVIWINGGSCPSGWIAANGSGGSPDLRGAFIRGLDGGRGLDPSRTLASFQADTAGPHNHPITDPGHTHTYSKDVVAQVNTGPTPVFTLNVAGVVDNTGSSTTGITVGNNTGTTESRPKNVALLACYHT